MKIKVLNAQKSTYWYSGYVGKEFDAVPVMLTLDGDVRYAQIDMLGHQTGKFFDGMDVVEIVEQ